MCLIVDANVVHQVFPEPSEHFRPIHEALAGGRASFVYGGELTREYQRTALSRSFLRRLDQQGAARQIPDVMVDTETKKVQKRGGYRSNDPHILALAIVSRVRLLCSEDEELGEDFTNPKILPRPRGNIYKRGEHVHLIDRHCREK